MMNNTNKHSFLLVAALLLLGMLTGCLKDDLSHCPRPFQVTIKALDADKNDITESGDVEQVVLFVFDEDGNIHQTLILSDEEVKQRNHYEMQVGYPASKSFQFIAWANLDEKVDFSDITTVQEMSDLYVKLKKQSSRSVNNSIAHSPGDLFYGSLEVPTPIGDAQAGQVHTIEINRMTVGITISAIGLKQWNGGKEGTYSYIVRESYDVCDCHGNMIGEKVNYAPLSSLNESGNLLASIFYAFPPEVGKGFVVDILFNSEVIYTADRDTKNVLFTTEIGRTLNIIIDFRANLQIITEITPWNVVFQYVGFN